MDTEQDGTTLLRHQHRTRPKALYISSGIEIMDDLIA
jgi:hypothetical protein